MLQLLFGESFAIRNSGKSVLAGARQFGVLRMLVNFPDASSLAGIALAGI